MSRTLVRLAGLAFGALLVSPTALSAQYFGQNKVTYREFDFREMHTPHFDIFYYPVESIYVADVARMAERWYTRHAQSLRDTFAKKPLVIYSDPPAFAQGNIVQIDVGGSTGGVTEPLRNRAIIPLNSDYQSTDHVLGHELVHTFQFDIAENTHGPGGGGLAALNRVPQWMIEGMAEYLSIGRNDPNTTMFIRDAMERNNLPTIKQLGRDPRFFVYRWGQALWAYIGGKYGDDVIPRIYRQALRTGMEGSIRSVLGISTDSLSREWKNSIRDTYTPVVTGRVRPENVGNRLLEPSSKRFPDADVGPTLSPDGKTVAFYTQRGLFYTDLYVADAVTGKILHKLTSPNRNPHYDALNFITSAGSFSPDGQKLAVGVYALGYEQIGIFDVKSGHLDQRIKVPGVATTEDIAWNTNNVLAFSGMKGGMSDLYLYDLKSGQVTQLTNDKAAQLQPNWSPDASLLAYVTDDGAPTDFNTLTYSQKHIAIRNMATGETHALSLFPGAKAINPQFSPDGKDLYFVSDPGGIPDVYRVNLESGQIVQITRVTTGVSGIVPLSPALAVAAKTGRMIFNVFFRGGYELHRLEPDMAGGTPVVAAVDSTSIAGIVNPVDVPGGGPISLRIADARTGLPPEVEYPTGPYRSQFGLEYLGSPGVGVAFGGPFGTGLAGGVSAYFGDNLENNVIAAQLSGAGQLADFGGLVLYQNQSHRFIWGASVGHIPYLTGGTFLQDTTLATSGGGTTQGLVVAQLFERTFYEQGNVFGQYPFSQARRLEASLGYTYVHYSITEDRYLEDQFGNILDAQYNVSFPAPKGLSLFQTSLAYVTDYSLFGLTSPIAGARYRFELDPTFGNLLFTTALADYRRYIWAKPVTFAFRLIHYGRYGRDAENTNVLYPLYVGDPYFIRGYDYNSFSPNECTGPTVASGGCPVFDRLFGSKIAAANFEIRFPLTGVGSYGLINFPYLPIDIAPFLDAGVAWYNNDTPVFKLATNSDARIPVFSSGVSTRINVLGYIVAEVFWAYPFERPQKKGIFGFQILPGW